VPARIAAAIDGYEAGQDAAALGARIAHATGAELMLVAVHPDPMVVLPEELGWRALHKQAEALLRETRDAVEPAARITVETDWSVARALERVVRREHRDLLAVGSSRAAPAGRVRIGRVTRQLLCHCESALAIAPQGMHAAPDHGFKTIGVGFDGGQESRDALAAAASIAASAGATLRVRGVVDDRIPAVGWSHARQDRILAMWDEVLGPQAQSLDAQARAAAGPDATVEALTGDPVEALREFSEEVDLLVIGSRRWGGAERVLLGSTGEGLAHDAACPLLIVPRAAG
jgi:nucleotide-binding universal stress UspA family protein